MKARISEIFESIQGEGIYLGERQIFVRFFGCNLSCRFCDTKADRFTEYESEELIEKIRFYQGRYHSISFTGGEPLLQKDFLKEVLTLTRGYGYKNYLETNGTLPGELKDIIDFVDIIAMDVKLPTSTGMLGLWGMHRRFLEIASQKEVFLKTIICQTTKEEDLREVLKLIKEVNKATILVLQPNSYEEYNAVAGKLESFKDICRGEMVTTCIIPQIHRIIGIK